jgi:hypothetical protein
MDCSVFGLIFKNSAISVESSSSSEVWSFRVIVALYSILCGTEPKCKAWQSEAKGRIWARRRQGCPI